MNALINSLISIALWAVFFSQHLFNVMQNSSFALKFRKLSDRKKINYYYLDIKLNNVHGIEHSPDIFLR